MKTQDIFYVFLVGKGYEGYELTSQLFSLRLVNSLISVCTAMYRHIVLCNV